MRRLDLWTRYYIRWNPTMQPQVRVIILHISFCPTWRNRQTFIASQRFATLLLEITFKHYRAKSGMPPPSGPRGAVSSFSFFTEFFGSRYGLHRKVGTARSLLGTEKNEITLWPRFSSCWFVEDFHIHLTSLQFFEHDYLNKVTIRTKVGA